MFPKNSVNKKFSVIKILTIVTISIIAIITVLIGGVITFVDPNHYRPTLVQAVEKATGAKLNMDRIHWRLTPNLTLVADNVIFDTQSEFKTAPLVSLNQIECSLSLLALLHGDVSIDKLTLEGLKLTLISDGKKNNWSFPISNQTNSNSPTKNYSLRLSEFSIKNASLSYTDLAKHKVITLPNLNLELKQNNQGPITIQSGNTTISMKDITYSINETLKGNVSIEYSPGNYTASIKANSFSLNDLLSASGFNKQKQFTSAPFKSISYNLNISGTPDSLDITNSNIGLGNSNIGVTFNAQSLSPLIATNQLAIDKLDLEDYISLSGYLVKMNTISIEGTLNEGPKSLVAHQKAHIKDIKLYGYDLHALAMQITTILNDPIKIISIPITINKIKSLIAEANHKGPKNLNLVSNLGSLDSGEIVYQDGILSTPDINLVGPDLSANAKGRLNQNNNQLDYQITARFTANPNTLTGKILYPLTITGTTNNPEITMNWNSVSTQLAKNLGNSITNTGKEVGKETGSTLNKIGKKIRSWF